MNDGDRSVRVVRSGALTTIQDAGRPGLAHIGVPRSGALDAGAFHLANRLVGNEETTAVLETTMDGVSLHFDQGGRAAVTGAMAPVHVDTAAAAWGLPVYLRPGQTLHVGRARRGVRSYVAIAGGLEGTSVLGSLSTDLLSGLGPGPLAAGDVLRIGHATGQFVAVDLAPYPLPAEHAELAIHIGPRHEWLTDEGLHALTTLTWRASPDSNRIALRLTGPPVQRRRQDELPSEGVVMGSIQSLPNGQLLIFLADHPTTGGYPVVAVVDPTSLGACAQARPGSTLSFRLA